MKIRTLIYISLFLLIITLILFSIITYISFQNISLTNKKHARANSITKNVSEMRALTIEYILSPEDRVERQWEINYRSLSALIAVYPQSSDKEKALISEIQQSQKKLQTIFAKLTSIIEKNSEVVQTDPILLEAQERLVGEILTASQGMVTDSLKLSEETQKQTIVTQTTSNVLILIVNVLLVFVCFVMLLLFKRKILEPLSKLEKATYVISRGDLDYVVKVSGNDEIGSLGKSFNNMTAKLKNLDAMKTDFLKIAAHQLRTPLGVMRWNVEKLLGDKPVPPEKQQLLLNETHTRVLQLISLIGELLVVYQVDQGSKTKTLSEVNLKDNIQMNINKLANLAIEKKVKINSQLTSGKDLKIKTDPEKLDSILQHLITNAILYSKDTGGNVDIDVSENKKMIVINIHDNGIGIPSKEIPNIFSRFFRASNAILAQPNGNGLGLFLVKSYVEEMGGKITLASKENEGTTVTITLPKNI